MTAPQSEFEFVKTLRYAGHGCDSCKLTIAAVEDRGICPRCKCEYKQQPSANTHEPNPTHLS